MDSGFNKASILFRSRAPIKYGGVVGVWRDHQSSKVKNDPFVRAIDPFPTCHKTCHQKEKDYNFWLPGLLGATITVSMIVQ